MAIGIGTSSKSAAWTTSPATPQTWNHASAVGASDGALVFACQTSGTTDAFTGVTYGGVAMTLVGKAEDSSGEPGKVFCYFLSDPPSGTQTVAVSYTGSDVKIAYCIDVTAGTTDTYVYGFDILEGNQANPQIALDSSSTTAIRVCCIFSGLPQVANLTILSGMTAEENRDVGARVTRLDKETARSTGSFTIGYTASSDDVAMFAVMMAEVGADVDVDAGTAPDLALVAPTPSVDAPVNVAAGAAPNLALVAPTPSVDAPVTVSAGTAPDLAMGAPAVTVDLPLGVDAGTAAALVFGAPAVTLDVPINIDPGSPAALVMAAPKVIVSLLYPVIAPPVVVAYASGPEAVTAEGEWPTGADF